MAAMEMAAHELASVRALVARLYHTSPRELRLEHRPLRGGLVAVSTVRVAVRHRDGLGHSRVHTLVIKRLAGAATHEAAVYEQLVAHHAADLAPRLLASDRPRPNRATLYLEALRPVRAWPWSDTRAAQRVLGRVAALHAIVPSADALAALAAWDYDGELQASSERTLERLEQVRRRPELSSLGAGVRWVRRIVAALPVIRRQLLSWRPLGLTVIHGDLHPGNVLLCRRGGRDEAVLIDWGRARIGSPLEDVSSWLQSLRAWEPEAGRRHDTLLADYLSARGLERRLGSDLRSAYWLAGASNALSGALLHHLSVILDARVTGLCQTTAAYAAREWIRVLRRADAAWT
jgi:hypothetical protein